MNEKVRTSGTEELGEIDLLDLVKVIWHRFWVVLLGLIVGGAAAFSVATYLMTPKYQATSTIYIFSKTTSITSLADLQIGSQLTEDFQIIAKTRDVIESVILELNLNTTYERLRNDVSIENPASSHMLQITAVDTDSERAAAISNKLSDKLRDQIADIMNTDRPSVVQRATPPARQSSPNVRNMTILGALIGAFLFAAVIVVRYLMDDTIKTSDDVHKFLNLDVLAEIPFVRSQTSHNAKGEKQHEKGSGQKSSPKA